MLKLVPMQAASWLDSRETPSLLRARSVTGIVAAVLDVLNVLAITSVAPRRNRHGDIRPKITITTRYQVTWQAEFNENDHDQPDQRFKDLYPAFSPHTRGDHPEDGQWNQRNDPEQHTHQQLEPKIRRCRRRPCRRSRPGLAARSGF